MESTAWQESQLTSSQWHAYNLILPPDLLTATAIRRIATTSTTGSTTSTRIHLTLTIRVTSSHYDSSTSTLHVSGRVASENPHVKLGAFHTLDLALNRNFTLEKADGWDSVAIEMVREAVREDRDGRALPAVVMQEGVANVVLVLEHRTVLKQRVEVAVPKIRGAGRSAEHDKGVARFYAATLEALTKHVDLSEQGKAFLFASPGFVAQGFVKFLLEEAERKGMKGVLRNREAFVVVHASSGHLHALDEVLKSPEVVARVGKARFMREGREMEELGERLRMDDGRAWYGMKEVEKAVAKGAVGRGGGVFLISNKLFRSQEMGVRKRWVTVVDQVKADGGTVRVLSSDVESGRKLEELGGVAALLTFPLEDLDEDEAEEVQGEEG